MSDTDYEETSSQHVLAARARLYVLKMQTADQRDRDMRRVTFEEHEAIEVILAELHRANKVMRDQQQRISEYAQAELKRQQKAAKH